MADAGPLIVWRVTDGIAGHARQTQGLLDALAARRPIEACDVPALSWFKALRAWSARRFSGPARAPDLILGAGRRTHLTVVAARAARGGRSVILMRPSLPRYCFDLCLIPTHDALRPDPWVETTRGALNPVRPAPGARAALGLLLIGGPSRHYGWDDAALLPQLRAILARDAALEWIIADSRRTPAATRAALARLAGPRVQYRPHENLPSAELDRLLGSARQAWVSRDSVSMIYEALSGGAAVGLLALPPGRPGRVARGVQLLLEEGAVADFPAWQAGRAELRAHAPLAEAQRCADLILARWFRAAGS